MSGDNLTPRLSLSTVHLPRSTILPYYYYYYYVHSSSWILEKETSNLSPRSHVQPTNQPTTDITVNFHAVLSKIPSFLFLYFLSINHFGLFALSFAQVWSYLLALLVCGHYYTSSRATYTWRLGSVLL